LVIILIVFLAMSGLAWFSIFGYLAFLRWKASPPAKSDEPLASWPDMAVVIPVRNEENLILSKLSNTIQADYPRKRMSIMVVDGRSTDNTAELVRRSRTEGEEIQLVCLDAARSKAEQVARALDLLKQEIVIVTDADALVERSCFKKLVARLQNAPGAAMVGAWVEPQTPLLEERLHWLLLNTLWWLEGEALGAASLSGVCYACRRSLVMSLSKTAIAEDIHLSLLSGANGFGVHISREARVSELRVPRTLAELVRFRRRRGAGYLAELRNPPPMAGSSAGWRLARFMRLWHFLATPKTAVVLLALGLCLLATPYRMAPLLVLGAFALPILAGLFSSGLGREKGRWWKLPLAAFRYLAFTLASLLTLNPRHRSQGPLGGKP
jgi:cellulose synthase/poly-beta-1,6-N-acetylglucosamine synthase-like glycosyltransferase